MKISLMTHRGAVRQENQDAVLVSGTIRTGDMNSPEVLETEGLPLLLAVVDGMGGYKGGALAARILAESLAEGAENKNTFGDCFDVEADGRVLRRLLENASAWMREAARDNPELGEMGATTAGILLREKSALAFNCGDCRIYRLSGGELERLTREHSIVELLYEKGEIDEEGMRTHPQKNIVTSSVSANFPDCFDLYTRGLSRCESDSFFLCSDGVWEALSARHLTQCLNCPSPEAARELFDALLEAKCHDNVSFVWGPCL